MKPVLLVTGDPAFAAAVRALATRVGAPPPMLAAPDDAVRIARTGAASTVLLDLDHAFPMDPLAVAAALSLASPTRIVGATVRQLTGNVAALGIQELLIKPGGPAAPAIAGASAPAEWLALFCPP